MLKEITSDLFENLDDKVIDIDWLSFREEIATELAKTHLFPSLAREFKHQLSDAARDFVKQKMSKSLWSYASKSPFKVMHVTVQTLPRFVLEVQALRN